MARRFEWLFAALPALVLSTSNFADVSKSMVLDGYEITTKSIPFESIAGTGNKRFSRYEGGIFGLDRKNTFSGIFFHHFFILIRPEPPPKPSYGPKKHPQTIKENKNQQKNVFSIKFR